MITAVDEEYRQQLRSQGLMDLETDTMDLKTVASLVVRVKEVIAYFHINLSRMKTLRENIVDEELKFYGFVSDGGIRWEAKYRMFERFYRLKDILQLVLDTPEEPKFLMTETDWMALNEIKLASEILINLIRLFEKEDSLLSIVIPAVDTARNMLQDIRLRTDLGKQFTLKITKGLEGVGENRRNDKISAVATALHPIIGLQYFGENSRENIRKKTKEFLFGNKQFVNKPAHEQTVEVRNKNKSVVNSNASGDSMVSLRIRL